MSRGITGSEEDEQLYPDDFDILKEETKEFIVTPRGMVGTNRSKWKGDLLIGRSQQENDIVLSNDDLAISRVHCRILYQDGFCHKKRLIPKAYMEFFKIFSDKHLSNHPEAPYFPKEIRMLIISFLRKPRKFYIQDMGSIHGTYLKLRHQEQKKLLTG